MCSLKELGEVLKKEDHYLLFGHVGPDGDCLGSLCALQKVLIKMNKKSLILLEDEPGEKYQFLPLISTDYALFRDFTVDDLEWPEINVIALDSGDRERLGPGSEITEEIFINIDHHLNNKLYGKLNYVDTEMAAVGEILYNLFESMPITLDSKIAVSLATAVIADTGSFRYQNTTPRVFRMMASLLEKEIDLYSINRALYSSLPYEAVKLKGLVLSTLKLSEDKKVAWLKVERSFLEKSGTELEDASGLVNYARDIKGVEVGLIFTEIGDMETRVGFRSNDYCPVNEIAAFFGGGGHARAAGCTFEGELDEAVSQVVNKVMEYV